MANLFEHYSINQFIILNFLAIFLGFSLRQTLSYVKQNWVTTYHQTLTYCLLPPITSIITNLISSNIALSLGMIGALSIVRFRTPVKSPLELVMFFALITIGIGVAVNFKLSIILTIIIIVTILFFNFIKYFLKKKKISFLISNYDEGISNHLLEISSKEKLNELELHNNLESYYYNSEEKLYNYRLFFQNKDEINFLKKSLVTNVNIKTINIKYVL